MDVRSKEWTQTVVEQLSPQAGEYASDVLHNQVEPIIQKYSSKVTECQNTQKKDVDESSVVIDGEFNYDGNCDLRVSLLGISSGVRDLRIFGRGRIVSQAHIEKSFTLFRGWGSIFYLLETPVINFDLDGIADICDWPFIRDRVRKELYEDMNKKIVYPNRITIPLSNNVDPMKFRSFAPLGMLAVKLLRAKDLPSKGGIRSLVGQGSPDAYAKVCLGAYRFDSDVKKNSCDPVWEDDGICQGAENGQEIRLEKELLVNENKRSKYEIQGSLSIAMRWLPFGVLNGDYDAKVNSYLKIFESNGPSPYKTEVEEDDQHPGFGYGKIFQFGKDWRDHSIDIRVLDVSGFVFGNVKLSLEELESSPHSKENKAH
ncbi:unnamed protein product [Lepeophtheirus salmonis]|uniref:(salmon louse) hypothetical protein n=1 Tax=Lepeophtheirus salmonis TaxID=72036 RepID=A0A7R8HEQ7_LEPSM|nr:unnamed protein product [Lepeophtheirus salmonis]CAF3046856.1 unnamed protein product [Lepeophtheirus salmonis]